MSNEKQARKVSYPTDEYDSPELRAEVPTSLPLRVEFSGVSLVADSPGESTVELIFADCPVIDFGPLRASLADMLDDPSFSIPHAVAAEGIEAMLKAMHEAMIARFLASRIRNSR